MLEGVGPIPISEIYAYAQLIGMDRIEERHELLHFAQVCDTVYLEALRRKQPKHAAAGKHIKGRRRHPTRR